MRENIFHTHAYIQCFKCFWRTRLLFSWMLLLILIQKCILCLMWNTKEKKFIYEMKKGIFGDPFLFIFYIHTKKTSRLDNILHLIWFSNFSHFPHDFLTHITFDSNLFITYTKFIHLRYSNLTPFCTLSTYIYLHFSCTSCSTCAIGTKLNLITQQTGKFLKRFVCDVKIYNEI